ncbi:hypothetical protein EDC01DRAFT_635314 [Geopyxis carbonaria]|nr:hypothetical protein EDC01DRAFT_635314 [Geopyxis carbonaria]
MAISQKFRERERQREAARLAKKKAEAEALKPARRLGKPTSSRGPTASVAPNPSNRPNTGQIPTTPAATDIGAAAAKGKDKDTAKQSQETIISTEVGENVVPRESLKPTPAAKISEQQRTTRRLHEGGSERGIHAPRPVRPSALPMPTTTRPGSVQNLSRSNAKRPESVQRLPKATPKLPDSVRSLPKVDVKRPASVRALASATPKRPVSVQSLPRSNEKRPDSVQSLPMRSGRRPGTVQNLRSIFDQTSRTTRASTPIKPPISRGNPRSGKIDQPATEPVQQQSLRGKEPKTPAPEPVESLKFDEYSVPSPPSRTLSTTPPPHLVLPSNRRPLPELTVERLSVEEPSAQHQAPEDIVGTSVQTEVVPLLESSTATILDADFDEFSTPPQPTKAVPRTPPSSSLQPVNIDRTAFEEDGLLFEPLPANVDVADKEVYTMQKAPTVVSIDQHDLHECSLPSQSTKDLASTPSSGYMPENVYSRVVAQDGASLHEHEPSSERLQLVTDASPREFEHDEKAPQVVPIDEFDFNEFSIPSPPTKTLAITPPLRSMSPVQETQHAPVAESYHSDNESLNPLNGADPGEDSREDDTGIPNTSYAVGSHESSISDSPENGAPVTPPTIQPAPGSSVEVMDDLKDHGKPDPLLELSMPQSELTQEGHFDVLQDITIDGPKERFHHSITKVILDSKGHAQEFTDSQLSIDTNHIRRDSPAVILLSQAQAKSAEAIHPSSPSSSPPKVSDDMNPPPEAETKPSSPSLAAVVHTEIEPDTHVERIDDPPSHPQDASDDTIQEIEVDSIVSSSSPDILVHTEGEPNSDMEQYQLSTSLNALETMVPEPEVASKDPPSSEVILQDEVEPAVVEMFEDRPSDLGILSDNMIQQPKVDSRASSSASRVVVHYQDESYSDVEHHRLSSSTDASDNMIGGPEVDSKAFNLSSENVVQTEVEPSFEVQEQTTVGPDTPVQIFNDPPSDPVDASDNTDHQIEVESQASSPSVEAMVYTEVESDTHLKPFDNAPSNPENASDKVVEERDVEPEPSSPSLEEMMHSEEEPETPVRLDVPVAHPDNSSKNIIGEPGDQSRASLPSEEVTLNTEVEPETSGELDNPPCFPGYMTDNIIQEPEIVSRASSSCSEAIVPSGIEPFTLAERFDRSLSPPRTDEIEPDTAVELHDTQPPTAKIAGSESSELFMDIIEQQPKYDSAGDISGSAAIDAISPKELQSDDPPLVADGQAEDNSANAAVIDTEHIVDLETRSSQRTVSVDDKNELEIGNDEVEDAGLRVVHDLLNNDADEPWISDRYQESATPKTSTVEEQEDDTHHTNIDCDAKAGSEFQADDFILSTVVSDKPSGALGILQEPDSEVPMIVENEEAVTECLSHLSAVLTPFVKEHDPTVDLSQGIVEDVRQGVEVADCDNNGPATAEYASDPYDTGNAVAISDSEAVEFDNRKSIVDVSNGTPIVLDTTILLDKVSSNLNDLPESTSTTPSLNEYDVQVEDMSESDEDVNDTVTNKRVPAEDLIPSNVLHRGTTPPARSLADELHDVEPTYDPSGSIHGAPTNVVKEIESQLETSMSALIRELNAIPGNRERKSVFTEDLAAVDYDCGVATTRGFDDVGLEEGVVEEEWARGTRQVTMATIFLVAFIVFIIAVAVMVIWLSILKS